MDCFLCSRSFNLSDRIPVLICGEGHTTCFRCSESLKKCPLCGIQCFVERKVNYALHDLVKASRDGDLCPQIPSDQIILGDEIGGGGFATVYSGEWLDLPVAVKMVALTEEGRLQLQKEMSLQYNLNHPSILRVFGISFFDKTIGIVMEKASSSLPTPNSLSPLTLRYATELCRAVMFLHLKSIVHGDLETSEHSSSR
ncbi:hypothetical protein GEMRC1_011077 [Eukaryota sp. GEM-RC1]